MTLDIGHEGTAAVPIRRAAGEADRAAPLAFSSADPIPAVELLLAYHGVGEAPQAVDRAIDSRDEMLGNTLDRLGGDWESSVVEYFRGGLGVFTAMRQVARWGFGGFAGVGSMLDFASGYGRVTRHLIRELPGERLTVSDIYADAMAFQHARFGVRTLVSAPAPEDVHCDERFDFIFVTSLFTHLPERTFVRWLQRLAQLLTPRGVLAWSVHDEELLPHGKSLPPSGLLFEASSESRSLDVEEYGSSWVSEEFVRRAVASLGEGFGCVRVPRGVCNYQDLYVATRRPPAELAAPIDPGPYGFLEALRVGRLDGERLLVEISGWAACRIPGAEVVEVEVRLGDELVGACRELEERPDVGAALGNPALRCGWGVVLPLPDRCRFSTTALLVRAISSTGVEFVVYSGSLAEALRANLSQELEVCRDRRRHDGEVAAMAAEEQRQRLELLGLRNEWLENRMRGMEASWFWRQRSRWFALKRALGLTTER